ncbi:hypothetical protein JMG10_08755 [Nostoc ellipsosporum NOK]|nr:hypothetical protein [Nostoc ellipsosporum NOK]
MKIFYAVQATGNGHISRAMELYPYLREYGTVDFFLSGGNSTLSLDVPVKYRSKGMSLYYNCNGGLDYWQIMKGIKPMRIRREIRELPVNEYDLVINDFDYITAAACASRGVPSVQFGHQASFASGNTPRPATRNRTGEWILKNYAKASRYIGLHFESYADFIFTPVIRRDILEAQPADLGHITVYLPSYCESQLTRLFEPFSDRHFEIFCGQISEEKKVNNIRLLPVSREAFSHSMIGCHGLITGGGFETPAEALHLGKKILSVPIRSQYEQQCNAAALEKMGVHCLQQIDGNFQSVVYNWLQYAPVIKKDYSQSIPQALDYLFAAKPAFVGA